jgi:hypothetical protein
MAAVSPAQPVPTMTTFSIEPTSEHENARVANGENRLAMRARVEHLGAPHFAGKNVHRNRRGNWGSFAV